MFQYFHLLTLKHIADMYLYHGDRRVEQLMIEDADHTYATLADEQTVIERTAAWFKETL